LVGSVRAKLPHHHMWKVSSIFHISKLDILVLLKRSSTSISTKKNKF